MKFLSNLIKKFFGAKKTAEFENIVVGKILEINKHPNADRLTLVKVDLGPSLPTSIPEGEKGNGNVPQIVCGASNIEVGQKVPVALVGAKLPNGIEIKEAEIRGIKSCGMLCAEDELGLGTDHSGIMILNEKAEIGMEFAKYINNR
jgi:phenylalanyl-tRNA synthetase beta chain